MNANIEAAVEYSETFEPDWITVDGYKRFTPYFASTSKEHGFLFKRALKDLRQLGYKTFNEICDIGAGTGASLLALGEEFSAGVLSGVELHPGVQYPSELDITNGDAFDYDCGSADLVYAYQPIISSHWLARMDVHVASTMKRGAIYLRTGAIPESIPELKQLTPMIFVKE